MSTIAILTSSRSDHLEMLQDKLREHNVSMQIEELSSPSDREVMLIFDFAEGSNEQELYNCQGGV